MYALFSLDWLSNTISFIWSWTLKRHHTCIIVYDPFENKEHNFIPVDMQQGETVVDVSSSTELSRASDRMSSSHWLRKPTHIVRQAWQGWKSHNFKHKCNIYTHVEIGTVLKDCVFEWISIEKKIYIYFVLLAVSSLENWLIVKYILFAF